MSGCAFMAQMTYNRHSYAGPGCSPDAHFQLCGRSVLAVGRPVFMVGFPLAVDEEMHRQSNEPLIYHGNVSSIDQFFALAAADYNGGNNASMMGHLQQLQLACGACPV
eukprot:jgi/Chrzof1/4345/Cz14g09160.t1